MAICFQTAGHNNFSFGNWTCDLAKAMKALDGKKKSQGACQAWLIKAPPRHQLHKHHQDTTERKTSTKPAQKQQENSKKAARKQQESSKKAARDERKRLERHEQETSKKPARDQQETSKRPARDQQEISKRPARDQQETISASLRPTFWFA